MPAILILPLASLMLSATLALVYLSPMLEAMRWQ